MKSFAVLDQNIVINTIISDSKEDAEQTTNTTCVEYTSENPAIIGGSYENGVFLAPKPYPSWVLDSNNNWVSPVSLPDTDKDYVWNEENQAWIEVV